MTHVTEHHDDYGPPAGDDQPMVMKRWLVAIIITAIIPIAWSLYDSRRVSQLEARTAEIAIMKEQIARIDQVIQMYEGPAGLRVQRAQEISKLQEQVSEIQRSFERQSALQQHETQSINDKLERLLSRGRP